MGHNIQGFVARENELKEILDECKTASIISLSQGFAFVPMSDEFYNELIAGREFLADISDGRFLYLSSKLFQIGREFSRKTPIAYFETDYSGGAGFQKAVAWDEGDVQFGPAVAGDEEGIQKDARQRDPANDALREIGVRGYLMEDENETVKDEFEELGLDQYRSNEDWIASLG